MSYTLTFSQLVGEFVTDKELLGAQDPYVVFEAGGRKTQTKVSYFQPEVYAIGSCAISCNIPRTVVLAIMQRLCC